MNIEKFRIWNYKSIVDSHICYPDTRVTILAGKNEAGKTSILEALEDFNSERNISEKAIPIHGGTGNPKICVWFKVPVEEITEILGKIGHTLKVNEETIIELVKDYPNTFTLGNETIEILELTKKQAVNPETLKAEATEYLERIAAIFATHQGHLQTITAPMFNPGNPTQTMNDFKSFKDQLGPILPNIPQPDSAGLSESVEKIIGICQQNSSESSFVDAFIEEFKNYFPNFILFSSFNDVFPNIVPLDQLDKNEWVEDLSIISNLEIETIKSSNDRKKIDHKTQLNIDINEEFGKFWVQDLSKMFIEWDNEKLSFWILEDGHHYEPEIRSQGKRWFLAFYVKVTARARENFNVILIDEPGLYLHAQAQKDVLNKLEDASEDAQIIFSTHSPYLIEADKLERIRLVQRTSAKGTTVENKIHKVADKETLTPILTAIGLEMTNSFSHIDRVNNFIIEGPSDFYFLQAFKKLTNTENINFIYGGGSGNMPKVGTILQGWGCNVFYLYDNDQGLKDALKNIKSDWITTTQEMIAKIPVEGAIEDIFSRDDYKKYVLRDEKTITKNTNSEYAKNSKRDKVLDAKLFLEYVNQNSVSLDKITENNIKKLIEILEAKFKKNF